MKGVIVKKFQCLFSATSALKVFDNDADTGTIDNGTIRVTGIKNWNLKDNV